LLKTGLQVACFGPKMARSGSNWTERLPVRFEWLTAAWVRRLPDWSWTDASANRTRCILKNGSFQLRSWKLKPCGKCDKRNR